MKHEPVLLEPVLEYLEPNRRDGILVDATVGLGGHAEALLERHPDVRLDSRAGMAELAERHSNSSFSASSIH